MEFLSVFLTIDTVASATSITVGPDGPSTASPRSTNPGREDNQRTPPRPRLGHDHTPDRVPGSQAR